MCRGAGTERLSLACLGQIVSRVAMHVYTLIVIHLYPLTPCGQETMRRDCVVKTGSAATCTDWGLQAMW